MRRRAIFSENDSGGGGVSISKFYMFVPYSSPYTYYTPILFGDFGVSGTVSNNVVTRLRANSKIRRIEHLEAGQMVSQQMRGKFITGSDSYNGGYFVYIPKFYYAVKCIVDHSSDIYRQYSVPYSADAYEIVVTDDDTVAQGQDYYWIQLGDIWLGSGCIGRDFGSYSIRYNPITDMSIVTSDSNYTSYSSIATLINDANTEIEHLVSDYVSTADIPEISIETHDSRIMMHLLYYLYYGKTYVDTTIYKEVEVRNGAIPVDSFQSSDYSSYGRFWGLQDWLGSQRLKVIDANSIGLNNNQLTKRFDHSSNHNISVDATQTPDSGWCFNPFYPLVNSGGQQPVDYSLMGFGVNMDTTNYPITGTSHKLFDRSSDTVFCERSYDEGYDSDNYRPTLNMYSYRSMIKTDTDNLTCRLQIKPEYVYDTIT